MKKLIVFLLIACVCLPVFAGCSTLKDGDKGAVVNMYLANYPQSLDPAALQLDADTALILNLIYQPLTSINEKGKTVSALANKWYGKYDTVNEEYEMYFELNTTSWSDDIAVSADNIVYAWKRILSPDYASPYASLLFPIKNAKAVKSGYMTSDDLGLYADDDKLLRIVFEYDYDTTLFAEIVSNIALSPLREDIITKSIKDNTDNDRLMEWDKNASIMVANGPFRVQSCAEGLRITLERNSFFYRDPEEDHLDKSVIPHKINCTYQLFHSVNGGTPVSEQQFQYDRYNEGKIFYTGNLTKDIYAANSDNVITNSLLSTYNYYFNTTNSILSNEKVRQALSVALDREAIADLLGTGEKASEGYVPTGVYNTGSGDDFRASGSAVISKTGDINKAKSLLAEAGVKNGELRLSYIASSTLNLENRNKDKYIDVNNAKIVAEYAKGIWEQLGFTITVEAIYPENLNKRLANSDFDIIGLDAAINSTDAFGYLAVFSKYYNGNIVPRDYENASEETLPFALHFTGIENDEYDTLIDSIVLEKDRSKRAELLHEAEAMLAQLSPATAVYQHANSYLVSSKISKMTTNYFGFLNLNKLKLKNYLSTNEVIAEEEKNIQDKTS